MGQVSVDTACGAVSVGHRMHDIRTVHHIAAGPQPGLGGVTVGVHLQPSPVPCQRLGEFLPEQIGVGHLTDRLDDRLALASLPDVTVCSFGDLLRVPSSTATLEEARSADLLLHVVDASNPDLELQVAAVRETLREIDAYLRELDTRVVQVSATIAASCAFMMPVATPPNAIVFSTGAISIPQMVRAGIALNIAGIITVTLISLFAAPWLLG